MDAAMQWAEVHPGAIALLTLAVALLGVCGAVVSKATGCWTPWRVNRRITLSFPVVGAKISKSALSDALAAASERLEHYRLFSTLVPGGG